MDGNKSRTKSPKEEGLWTNVAGSSLLRTEETLGTLVKTRRPKVQSSRWTLCVRSRDSLGPQRFRVSVYEVGIVSCLGPVLSLKYLPIPYSPSDTTMTDILCTRTLLLRHKREMVKKERSKQNEYIKKTVDGNFN